MINGKVFHPDWPYLRGQPAIPLSRRTGESQDAWIERNQKFFAETQTLIAETEDMFRQARVAARKFWAEGGYMRAMLHSGK